MGESSERANFNLKSFVEGRDPESLERALRPKAPPAANAIPMGFSAAADEVLRRRRIIGWNAGGTDLPAGPGDLAGLEAYSDNIENLVGTVELPVGVAGPLRINGLHAQGDFIIPLATHEAALVASFHRGALAISSAGGCTALLLNEGVSRSPGFVFRDLVETGKFLAWALPREAEFREIAESTTRHGKLVDINTTIEGNHVYLRFDYHTGDAAGQNMVTIATQAVCDHIAERSPVRPEAIYVEANLSGDKKASSQSFQHVRGKKVTCEVELDGEILRRSFRAGAGRMEEYWKVSAMGGALSGTIGIQGHYANGLAALFIACGQDAACVAEASVGITRFEARGEALYATVTLPNLIVGTVGGGTGLPTQRACLELLGLFGEGKARAFAEVCAGVVLAGELSIIASLATGGFSRAHEVLARLRKNRRS
ncbi:MAG: hydroxymethylglutaryl-CoA reductase [Puniceicoccaceae bacterium]